MDASANLEQTFLANESIFLRFNDFVHDIMGQKKRRIKNNLVWRIL